MKTTRIIEKDGHRGVLKRTADAVLTALGMRTKTAPSPMADAAARFAFTPKEGRYEKPRELTRGGMGVIYSVYDRDLERGTAMKVALPAVLRDEASLERFVNEARITARLEHPHVVPVHDMGQSSDTGLFFTMKRLRGAPLDDILDRLRGKDEVYEKRYSRHALLVIFRKVCDAVSFAHSRGVIHLDIKPENIMVGDYGEVQLMDWGIAQTVGGGEAAGDAGEHGFEMPRRVIRGTPCYMSPEQARGVESELDEQTDLFLLGACLYHIIALVPPYSGLSTDDVLRRAEERDLVPLREQVQGGQVPAELCQIVEKAMAADKAARYASTEALARELDRFLSGSILIEKRTFAAGDVLMREGETGREGYVVQSGIVDVYPETPEGRTWLSTLGAGDVVGEMAMITHEQRSATVIAREKTTVQVITEEHMQSALGKLPPWMTSAVDALAHRLHLANTLVHPLLVRGCGFHVAAQLFLLIPQIGEKQNGEGEKPVHLFQKEDAVYRIAAFLGVPRERVQRVLAVLSDGGLVHDNGDGRLGVDDIERFDRFIRHCEALQQDMICSEKGTSPQDPLQDRDEAGEFRDLYTKLVQSTKEQHA